MLTKQVIVFASIVVSLLMVVMANLVRFRSAKKPVVAKKIILPPFFMATGASMYILPMFRPTLPELISSVVMGMLFSILLIRTSKFEIRGNQIYLQKSKIFIAAFMGLVALRMIAKVILADTIHIDPVQMSGIFFIMAFSMILPWRISMYIEFRKLKRYIDKHKP